jgi:hypothetical protein
MFARVRVVPHDLVKDKIIRQRQRFPLFFQRHRSLFSHMASFFFLLLFIYLKKKSVFGNANRKFC